MHVGLFGTPWTVTCQAPLAMAFFRQEYWSGLTFPTSGDLLNPGIKPKSVLDLEISLLTDLIPHLEPAAMFSFHPVSSGVPWWLTEQRICLQCRKPRLNPWVRKTPWRKVWQPTPVFLPREFHGQRGLVGYSPWGHKESDTTEWLSLFSCLLQTSCSQIRKTISVK